VNRSPPRQSKGHAAPATSVGLEPDFVLSGFGVAGVRLLSIGLGLLLSIVLARGLGPVAFGEYAFATTLIYILSLPIGQALTQLVTRESSLASQTNNQVWLSALLRWGWQRIQAVSVLVVVLVGMVALPQATWAAADRWTLVLLATPALPFIGAIAVHSGVLAGLKYVVIAQIAELLVRPAVQLAIVGAALASGMLVASVATLAYTAAAIAGFAIAALLSWRYRPSLPVAAVSLKAKLHWSRSWLPFVLLVAASAVNAQLGILLLGWLATSEQAGAMQIAEQGSRLVALSLTIANMVIGPYVARAWLDHDLERLQALSRRSARIALLASLPVALPLMLFAGPIVGLVFGADYVALAAFPLSILAGGQLVNVAFGSVGLLLTMSGHERDALLGLAAGLVLNSIAALLLIPHFQAAGAALSSVLGLVTWNLLLAIRVRRRVGLRPGAL